MVIPSRDLLGSRGELRPFRNHSCLKLPLPGLFAVFVPPHVEAAFVPPAPIERRLMRRVGGTGGEIDEERTVRGDRLLSSHPVDAIIGQVASEVVAILRFARNRHGACTPDERWIELVGLTADEPIEVIKAAARRPVIEG